MACIAEPSSGAKGFDIQAPTGVYLLAFSAILGLGMEGLAARRRVNDEITDFMLQIINHRCGTRRPLSRETAMAIAGGVNELVLRAIETGRVENLRDLALPAVQLVRAVTQERG